MAERVKFESSWAPKEGQLEAVRERIMEVHDNEETVYTSCAANGCFDLCVLKVHKKDGKVTAIETDDTINLGSGREDSYTDLDRICSGLVQHRACPRGRSWKESIYAPTRLLYPMKRKHWSPDEPNGHLRGEDEYERITWDEALDYVANAYRDTREKYGPYSVWMDTICGNHYDPYAGFLPGGGINGTGIDSFYPNYVADDCVYGYQVNFETWMEGTAWNTTEGPAILNSDLIILWGVDVVLNYPEFQYWFQLAKDKNIPIIYIDPRYSNTAQTMATQYIPIRPGTDAAAMLAMAYVMFDEELYDKAFCDEWVEPKGLELFRKYVMGEEDGDIPKTPEWAAEICGIPAETIAELARLYASKDTVYFRQVWAAARMVNGVDTARIYNYLNVLGGNVGKSGSCIGPSFDAPHIPTLRSKPTHYLGTAPAEYQSPQLVEAEQWARAVLMHEQLENGEITEQEYKAAIGCPENNPIPNIKALIYLIESPRQFIGNYQDTNERIEAVKKLDFVAISHWDMAASSSRYADILMPLSDWRLEGGSSSGYFGNGPFCCGLSPSLGNYFMYYNKVIDAPGECMHPWWVEKEIGKRLGLGDKVMPFIKDATPEDMDEIVDTYMGAVYESWASNMTDYPEDIVPQDWETFKKKPIIIIPQDYPHTKFEDEIKNKTPFKTRSGKLEFYNEHYAEVNPKGVSDMYGAALGEPLPPMARWRPSQQSLFSAKTKEYPLYLVTPHSFFRQNMNGDANLLMRDEYRNSVWLNPADAKARNVKDGDLVLAFNEAGEVMVPAYVTSRISPGCACLIFGRYYEPNGMKTEKMPDGIDRWGNCNFLTPNNQYGDIIGPLLCAALIDVKKADSSTFADAAVVAQNGGN